MTQVAFSVIQENLGKQSQIRPSRLATAAAHAVLIMDRCPRPCLSTIYARHEAYSRETEHKEAARIVCRGSKAVCHCVAGKTIGWNSEPLSMAAIYVRVCKWIRLPQRLNPLCYSPGGDDPPLLYRRRLYTMCIRILYHTSTTKITTRLSNIAMQTRSTRRHLITKTLQTFTLGPRAS